MKSAFAAVSCAIVAYRRPYILRPARNSSGGPAGRFVELAAGAAAWGCCAASYE